MSTILHTITHRCIGVTGGGCPNETRLWFTPLDRCDVCRDNYEEEKLRLEAAQERRFGSAFHRDELARMRRAGEQETIEGLTKPCSGCGTVLAVAPGASPPYFCRACRDRRTGRQSGQSPAVRRSDDGDVYGNPLNPANPINTSSFETSSISRSAATGAAFFGLGGESGGAGASGSFAAPDENRPAEGARSLYAAPEPSPAYTPTPSSDYGSGGGSSGSCSASDYGSGSSSSYDSGSSSSSSSDSGSSSSGSSE